MSTFHLDITQDHCPMTFVKTKLQLSKMQRGDILELLLTAGEPLENIPKSVVEHGFQVLGITPVKDDIYKVVIAT